MAPLRLAARCVAAALLALVATAAAQAPAAGCRLPLYLNASASILSLAGSSVDKPVSFALTPAFPDAPVGLEGALALALPGGGPCPTDAAGLAAQLAGATLQPSDAAGPLLLYPTTQIVVRSCGRGNDCLLNTSAPVVHCLWSCCTFCPLGCLPPRTCLPCSSMAARLSR